MRKVLPISLLVLIIVCASVYSIAWFGQASAIKKTIEQNIALINAKQQYITYESIETSGFPLTLNVSIVKPHFAGRVDTLLKAIFPSDTIPAAAPGMPPRPNPFTSLPEWNEDIAIDGRIELTINALSNLYTSRVTGNWKQTTKIKDQTIVMDTQPVGDSVCTLQIEHKGGIFGQMWDYKALSEDGGKGFIEDFRVANCSQPGYVTSDDATKEKMIGYGPVRMYVTSTPQAGQRNIRAYMKITDGEFTPAGDKLIAMYIGAFSPDYPYPVKYSVYGKQNMEVDFSYAAPADWNGDFRSSPVAISLNKFQLTNQVYTISMASGVNNAVADSINSLHFNFKAEENFTEQYDLLVQDVVRGIINQVYNNTNPQIHAPVELLQKYKPEELYAIVYPAVPNFHSLGKTVQNLDVSFKGNLGTRAGDITLAALELSASPYGVSSTGTAKFTAGQLIPAANVALTCTNCMHLVDDVFAYAGRMQKVFITLNPDKPIPPINPQLADGIKNFLTAVKEPAKEGTDATTFQYTFLSDGAGGVTLSGKRMDEVMNLYGQNVAQVLHTPAPQH